MPFKSHKQKLIEWQRAKHAPPPEVDLSPTNPSFTAMVSMRDNVKLYTEVFVPNGEGSYPVILHRSPYPMFRPSRHDPWPLARYIDAGYVFVFQNTRGQYLSEGEFEFHRLDVDDGYDCINWITEQGWCNGCVGMEGSSYAGSTQLYAAKANHPALKCIMPTAFGGSPTTGFPFTNGVPVRAMFLQWLLVADTESMADLEFIYGDMQIAANDKWGSAFRRRPLINAADGILSGDKLKSWKSVISHPMDGDYWQDESFKDSDLEALDIPIFITAGWLDPTVGPLDYFQRMELINSRNKDSFLLIGPWDHSQTFRSSAQGQSHGERKMPSNSGIDLVGQRLAFFDRYLNGNINQQIQKNRVQVYVTGLDQWFYFGTFPPPEVIQDKLYLESGGNASNCPSDGQLVWSLSEGAVSKEISDQYVYDPLCPTEVKLNLSEYLDQRQFEMRSDVLTYTSTPLEEPLTLLGEVNLILYASSNCLDTDWFAQISEVFPDGRSVLFFPNMSALRARYRFGMNKEVLLNPGEPTEFHMPLGSLGHQIAAGNAIRLSIYSASFPAFDPNLNTGKEVAFDIDSCVAFQNIFSGGALSSHLILPILTIEELEEL